METPTSSFRLDYTVNSRAWAPTVRRGQKLPHDSVLAECTAVGFTARRRETWSDALRDVDVQAVGAPPFPEHRFPRVLGMLHPRGSVRSVPDIEIAVLHGDATRPQGPGEKVIVHIVNDRTTNWGGAFARALRDRYPAAQDDFREWVRLGDGSLRLGSVCVSQVAEDLHVATIVAQHGYGQSRAPRLRYTALREGLRTVAGVASVHGARVAMPRIGAGQAGGSWPLIRELIEETLTRNGIAVTVYVPPNQSVADPVTEPAELTLGI